MIKNLIASSLILLTLLSVFCAKKEEAKVSGSSGTAKTDVAKPALSDEKAAMGNPSPEKEEAAKSKLSSADIPSFKTNFIADFNTAKDRSLEYSIDLTYRTSDITISREELLKIISKYGFLLSSSASISEYDSRVNVVFSIKAAEMYNALIDLKSIGNLVNESINVTDHTETVIWNGIKNNREKERIDRKLKTVSQVGAENKYLEQREESLEASEDNLDNVKFDEWKIKDRVYWANLKVNLLGPEPPHRVLVPNFKEALIDFFNNFLKLIYVFITILPFIIIIGILFWKWKWMKEKFSSLFKKRP